MIDPATRGTHDVSHTVAAVASSSGLSRAEKFKADLNIPSSCAAYGTYEELVQDKNVDIIYVASPHSHHYEHTILALNAGKHVVCEKPITVNASQAKSLYEIAKKKNLFLLDAVWTRYFPLSVQIRQMIQNGEIGEVLRVVADTSMGEDTDDLWYRQKRRKVNRDLAGGALLESKSFGFFETILSDSRQANHLQLASIRSPGYSRHFITPCLKSDDSLLPRSCLT